MKADQFIKKWTTNGDADSTSDNVPDLVLARIRQLGFVGQGGLIELEDGYFFPLSTSVDVDDAIVFVAAGLRWTHGGPGLVALRDVAGLHKFQDVGVFVGLLPGPGESIDLA